MTAKFKRGDVLMYIDTSYSSSQARVLSVDNKNYTLLWDPKPEDGFIGVYRITAVENALRLVEVFDAL